MGAWGFGLFESDDAYDIIGEIEERAGCLLHNPRRKREVVAKRLDDVVAKKLLDYYGSKELGAQTDFGYYYGSYYVFVGALIMLNGAKLPEEHRERMLDNVTFANVREFEPGDEDEDPEASLRCVAQMREALEQYKDGICWEFEEKGLFDTILDKIASGEGGLVNV